MLPVDKAAFVFSTYTQLCYIGLKNQTKILKLQGFFVFGSGKYWGVFGFDSDIFLT